MRITVFLLVVLVIFAAFTEAGKKNETEGGENGEGNSNKKTCKYETHEISQCDESTGRRTAQLRLKKGDPETCAPEKTMTKKCKGMKGKKACKYETHEVSQCDESTGTRTAQLRLKKGDPETCAPEKTVTRICKGMEGKKVTAVTFDVAEVPPATKPLRATSSRENLTVRIKQKIESSYQTNANIVSSGGLHGLVQAVHMAYGNHYPLVLSPDMIWLCITQGLAIHINENSEQLREKFVSHSGKKEIKVRRDEFVKGLATNPWPEVFGEFSEKIKNEIGVTNYDLITPNFTTTGPMEKAVGDIALMDTMQSYFTYTFITLCGIPSITLEGTKEDWVAVRDKAEQLEQYDLKRWTKQLLPVLDQFVNASSGNIDKEFWCNIYKVARGSGGPYITGWIITLFPYLQNYGSFAHNQYLNKWSEGERFFFGATTKDFPSGLSKVPFQWLYHFQQFEMQFIGGFMAVSQDHETLALRPELGWAVVEDGVTSEESEYDPRFSALLERLGIKQ
ncbi:uncharacterized protein [Ptychodera flava]|uniref:uncharacterized protein isoform X2 n=1 Tax=Ptychodera flava TaxID=63121 RepID=UPI003969DD24